MTRYIDVDLYKKENAEILDCEIDHPKYQDTLRELIDDTPTADVVEVVRCKYCAYYDPWVCWLNDVETGDNWFCAGGERKE